MAKIPTFGVVFKRGDGATPTEAFTAVEEVISISGPGASRTVINTPKLAEQYMTKIGGVIDEGQLTVEMDFDPDSTEQAAIISTDIENTTPWNYQIVFTDDTPTTWEFAALVSAINLSIAHDDRVTVSMTFDISGEKTVT